MEQASAEDDERGDTLLTSAVRHGNVSRARELLETGAEDVDARSTTGGTPLFISCQNNEPECARLLLEHGANTELAVTNGATPLSIACQEGHDAC